MYLRHKMYLRLPTALAEKQTHSIGTPYGTINFYHDSHATFCESIKVNQVGYSTAGTSRYANYGVYMGDGGSIAFRSLPSYQVIDEASGAVVTSGGAIYMGDDTYTLGDSTIRSGEHVYRLKLDAVPAGGPYFVAVPGCGRSYSFGVGNDFSRWGAFVATRGLYHQRCGIALTEPYTHYTRAQCHTTVFDTRAVPDEKITVPSGTRAMSMAGGYHDAGDYDRRGTHTIIPELLLSYYEAFPQHFIDGQYNIPESGNGIPDIVDEALWAVKAWENLQVSDPADPEYGGMRYGTEQSAYPTYGLVSAASDPGLYGTWDVTNDVTAHAAGFFAHASRLIRTYDAAHADALLKRSQLAWAYLQKNADLTQLKASTMYAALQLYLATGDSAFHDIFKTQAAGVVIKGAWPEQYLPGNKDAHCVTAHFIS